jgi:protein O-GlcNAc transferase
MTKQLQLAFAHHQAGRRMEAEELCRRMLEREPGNAGALQLLGLMAQQQGRPEVALKLMRMAVGTDPGVADYHNSLGTVLADLKLKLYEQVDIALDTHPYAGMTTTCDAMWMGVPTVTLAGASSVSRTGVSLLNAAGLPEWVAGTDDQYIEIAAGLASNLPRLSAMRAGLRERVRSSPLWGGRRLARELESACRATRREWSQNEVAE